MYCSPLSAGRSCKPTLETRFSACSPGLLASDVVALSTATAQKHFACLEALPRLPLGASERLDPNFRSTSEQVFRTAAVSELQSNRFGVSCTQIISNLHASWWMTLVPFANLCFVLLHINRIFQTAHGTPYWRYVTHDS